MSKKNLIEEVEMSFWCHYGVILVSLGPVVGILFELIFDEFSINFRWILTNFSTFQCHIGVILVSFWYHF